MLAVLNFKAILLKIYSVCLPPLPSPTFLLIPFCQYSRDETWIIKEILVKRAIAKLPCLHPSSHFSFKQMDKHSFIATFPLSVLAKICLLWKDLQCTLHPLLLLSTSPLSFQSWAYVLLHNLTHQAHQVGNKSVLWLKLRAEFKNIAWTVATHRILALYNPCYLLQCKGSIIHSKIQMHLLPRH